jgi:hypothetical protein
MWVRAAVERAQTERVIHDLVKCSHRDGGADPAQRWVQA